MFYMTVNENKNRLFTFSQEIIKSCETRQV